MGFPKNEFLPQFLKFGLVGLLNTIISYVGYLLLVMFGAHYAIANFVGFSVSVANSYYWNNRYVFAGKGRRVWWKTFAKTYASYAVTGLVLSTGLLYLWIDVLHLSSLIAPVINLVVTVPVNFVVNKFWAYKE